MRPTEHGRSFWKSWPAWALGLNLAYIATWPMHFRRTLLPDELRTFLLMAGGGVGELMEYAREDLVQTPLAYLLSNAWVEMFGGTDFAVKALPLLVGLCTIALFTKLASRVTTHWRWSSLLFGLFYLRVGSAVNLARMYCFLMLFVVLALYLWDRWSREADTRTLAAWTATMVLLFYTHLSGLLLLPAFVAANWIYAKRQRAMLIAAALSLAALLPWIAYVYPTFADRGIEANVSAIFASPHRTALKLPFRFMTGEEPGGGSMAKNPLRDENLRSTLTWLALAAAAALAALAASSLATGFRRRREETKWIAISTLLCVLPFAALYTVSVLFTPVLHARYLLVTQPAFYLLIPLLVFSAGRVGRGMIGGVVLFLLLAGAGATWVMYRGRSNVRLAAIEIAAAKTESDIVLSARHMPVGWRMQWEWTRRLGREDIIRIRRTASPPWVRRYFPGVELETLDFDRANRVWLVYSRSPDLPELSDYLERRGFTIDDQPASRSPLLRSFSREVDRNDGRF